MSHKHPKNRGGGKADPKLERSLAHRQRRHEHLLREGEIDRARGGVHAVREDPILEAAAEAVAEARRAVEGRRLTKPERREYLAEISSVWHGPIMERADEILRGVHVDSEGHWFTVKLKLPDIGGEA